MNWWDGPIIQQFFWSWLPPVIGWRRHSGIDIGLPYATPITCPVNGTILGAGCFPWGGQVDVLTHLNDKGGGSSVYVISFLHLSQIAGDLKDHIGQHITAGTTLGYSGGTQHGTCPTSGKYSKSPHLHFEISFGDVAPYSGAGGRYSPWQPSKDHFPEDPNSVFEAIKNNGGVAPSSEPGGPSGPGSDGGPGPGAKAHGILGSVPGFLGLCEALDTVETFEPFSPPPADNTPGTGGLQTAGNTFGYAVTWTGRNLLVIFVRLVITGVGIALLWLLVWGLIGANRWIGEAGSLAAAAAIGAV